MSSMIITASFAKDKIFKYLTGDNTGKASDTLFIGDSSSDTLLFGDSSSDKLLSGDSSSPSSSESESLQLAQEARSTDPFPSFGLDS